MGEPERPSESEDSYDPPRLEVLGSILELTLHGGSFCIRDKTWGGSDGFTWHGIQIPVSSC
jgi:hypothetical protein